MNGWMLLLEGAHESLMMEIDGEVVNPEYRMWNAQLRDNPYLTEEQRNELLYNMTERCYAELTDGLRVKDLMGDMLEVLQQQKGGE